MPFKQLMSDLWDKYQQNLQEGNENFNNTMKQGMDRANMQLHPELSGPRLPDSGTPDEHKYFSNLAQSMPMIGRVAPVAGAIEEAAAPAVKEGAEGAVNYIKGLLAKSAPGDLQAAQATMNSAENTASSMIPKAQQSLSRAVDMEARQTSQRQLAKQAALNKLRGM